MAKEVLALQAEDVVVGDGIVGYDRAMFVQAIHSFIGGSLDFDVSLSDDPEAEYEQTVNYNAAHWLLVLRDV